MLTVFSIKHTSKILNKKRLPVIVGSRFLLTILLAFADQENWSLFARLLGPFFGLFHQDFVEVALFFVGGGAAEGITADFDLYNHLLQGHIKS